MSPAPRHYPNVSQNMEDQIYNYLHQSNILSELVDECFNNPDADGKYQGFHEHSILSKSQGYFQTYISAPYIMNMLVRDKAVVVAARKDIGTLFTCPYAHEICIPVELIYKVEQSIVLTPVQMHEVERLLNMADLSLNINLPALPQAGDVELREAMLELAREIILSKPRAYRPKFLEKMKLKGYPVTANEAAFKDMAKKFLQP